MKYLKLVKGTVSEINLKRGMSDSQLYPLNRLLLKIWKIPSVFHLKC